ncbi:hypothetical protein HBH84_155440 [Parastagonospora nodorum]|nr:hypothetical protein HBH84_155440 [Parastagonospora nodorum]
MRLKKNVLESPYKKIKLKRYASSNKETPVILLSQLLTNNRTMLYIRGLENSASATAYALNYLKLQVLKLTLIGTVLYNAIKEYHNDRMRKTIYFYSYTIEKDYNYAGKREDNILTVDKCRTSYSNKEDIEANKREEETKVITHNDDEQV